MLSPFPLRSLPDKVAVSNLGFCGFLSHRSGELPNTDSPQLSSTQVRSRLVLWLELLTVGAIVATGVTFRLIAIDRIPGLNGDEAWFGVQVTDALAGRPFHWHTPTGNPLSPFHAGVLYLLHLAHPAPAFWLLRVPSLAAGLLLVGLAYPMLHKPLGSRAAMVATLLLASLPVAIIYSRIGWDPSQSPCAVLVCLGLVFQRRYLWAGCAFLAALLVHPSNIFAAPALLGPLAADGIVWLVQQHPTTRKRVLRWIAPGCTALVLVVLALPALLAPDRTVVHWGAILRRAIDPRAMVDFAIAFGRLFSGATSYRYIVGDVPAGWVLGTDIAFWILCGGLGALGMRRLVRQRQWQTLGLAGGLLLSLTAFYLVAGVAAIRPHHERYALFCIPLVAVLFAKLVAVVDPNESHKVVPLIGTALLCAAMLVGFHTRYFRAFERTGGASHETYWTGVKELKQAAFDIVARNSDNESVILLAESWWLYWPMRYLAAGQGHIQVVAIDSAGTAAALSTLGKGRRAFAVGFAGGTLERLDERRQSTLRTWSLANAVGKDVLYVWELTPSATVRRTE